MKATGIVRKVDNLGRVVLPKELRKALALKEGDPLEIFTDGEAIILKSYKPGCIFCGEANETKNFNGKLVCRECINKLTKGIK